MLDDDKAEVNSKSARQRAVTQEKRDYFEEDTEKQSSLMI
jgi:hypothetical protein